MGYTDQDFERILTNILTADYELKTERTSAILKVLRDVTEGQKPHLFAFVLKNFGFIEDCGEPMKDERMSDDRYQELVKSLGNEVHRLFHAWIKKNPTEEELGGKLQKYFFGELTNDEERSVALSIILGDRHIPYRRIPLELLDEGITGSDIQEVLEGHEVEERMKEDAAIIQNILRRKNLTTPMMILLWNIVNRHKTEAERFVLFSTLLGMVENEAKHDAIDGLGSIGGMIASMFGGR
ncbi:MAG: hypothetical protein V1696_03325 [Candidatus Jorgensenbacteria bacterium]